MRIIRFTGLESPEGPLRRNGGGTLEEIAKMTGRIADSGMRPLGSGRPFNATESTRKLDLLVCAPRVWGPPLDAHRVQKMDFMRR